jgi:hypothetical protein
MGAGRPRKHSDDAIANALRETGGVRSEAARRLGYSYQGLNDRIRSSPVLMQVLEEEQVVLRDTARRGIAAAIYAECQRAEAAERGEGDLPSMVTSRWLLGKEETMRLAVNVAGNVQHGHHGHEHTLSADPDKLAEVLAILRDLGDDGEAGGEPETRLS